MRKNKFLLLLIGITILGGILRMHNLGNYPALNADEAALGYNAYSLIKTGRDEHGNPWPMNFQSFNDYKPGLLVYLIIPPIYAFGLNEWTVRAIPALLGVLTIPVFYLLALKISGKRSHALVAALLLAVSPWHIHFSRGAWEVNIANFLVLAGACAFLHHKDRRWLLSVSVVLFVLSMYTYHSARIIAPLLGLALALFHFKDLTSRLKSIIAPSIIGVVLLIPLALSLFGPSALSRAGGVGIWSDMGPVNRANELRGNHQEILLGKVMHNKLTGYALVFFNNWAEHYSGEFLFIGGDDIQRNKVPAMGQLYLFEALTILFGLYQIVRNPNKKWGFVIFWLMIAPIPAALTFQSPHALRAGNMVMPLIIISSFGLSTFFERLAGSALNLKIKKSLLLLFVFMFSYSVGHYLVSYYKNMSIVYPFSSQYGVKELVSELTPSLGDKSKPIVVTDRYDQPYILFLFYGVQTKNPIFEPKNFQVNHKLSDRDLYGFSTVRSFGNLVFESVNFEESRIKYPNSIIVGTGEEIPREANIRKEIYGTNNYKYFSIVEN